MAPTSDARPAKDSMSNLGRRRRAARSDGSDEYAARKQELLQVAVRVFRAKGYERTTIADIAEAAGTDRASLYYYVANKEELYIEIMNQIGRNPAAERSQHIAEEDRPAAERLRTLMVELMAAYHEQYPLLYIDLQENPGALDGHDPSDALTRLHTARNRHFAAFRKVIQDGMLDGTFKSSLPPGVAAEAAIGMVGWSYRWFDPEQSRYSGTEIGEAFADFILNGLVVDEALPAQQRSEHVDSTRAGSKRAPTQSRDAS